jgi:hypothetical protein
MRKNQQEQVKALIQSTIVDLLHHQHEYFNEYYYSIWFERYLGYN